MRRRRALRLLIPFLSLLTGLFFAELLVRLAHNNHPRRPEVVWGVELKPYCIEKLKETAKQEEQQSYLCRDSQLGWSIQPKAQANRHPYVSNRYGLRSLRVEDGLREGMRVAAFGDSFTHCDEVRYEDSWTYLLEQKLGNDVQVLNGGVCGYGADQAWLRYRSLKDVLKPDVVVLGLSMTAFRRNLNVFRLLAGEWTSWTKPRFVLDGELLKVVNQPTLSTEDVARVLRTGEGITKYEPYYDSRDWTWSLADHSLLIRTLKGKLRQARPRVPLYRKGCESYEVTLRIVEGFRKEVKESGAKFLCVIITERPHLTGDGSGRWRPLVNELREKGVELVNPSGKLNALKEHDDLIAPGGHYLRRGNEVIARAVARALRN